MPRAAGGRHSCAGCLLRHHYHATPPYFTRLRCVRRASNHRAALEERGGVISPYATRREHSRAASRHAFTSARRRLHARAHAPPPPPPPRAAPPPHHALPTPAHYLPWTGGRTGVANGHVAYKRSEAGGQAGASSTQPLRRTRWRRAGRAREQDGRGRQAQTAGIYL